MMARRRGRISPGVAAAIVAGAYLAAGHTAGRAAIRHESATLAPTRAAAIAIAYARAQLGRPYCWGGTGGSCYDCSGLVMEAYASAGVTISRTSQDQWATGHRVASPRAGDLVFFAGGDGTWSAPGHVGLVIGRNLMIEAYAPGYPIRVSAFGISGAPGGDESPVGFTRPSAGGS